MVFFYKILNGLTPKCLFDSCYNTRAQPKWELTQFYKRTKSSTGYRKNHFLKKLRTLNVTRNHFSNKPRALNVAMKYLK